MATSETTSKSTKNTANSATANESINEAFQHMQGAAQSVKAAASSLTSSSSDAAVEALQQGKSKAISAGKDADTWIKNSPYTSMGIAFAAGVVLTGLLKK